MASNSNETLKYFTSVPLTDDHKGTTLAMEDILQREHNPDGSHPVATESQSGFISATDLQRLRKMYEYLKGLQVI